MSARSLALALALCGCAARAAASPCDGMRESVTAAQKAAWSPALAAQLAAPRTDVLASFRDSGWRIILVDSHIADEAYLFYDRDPRSAHYVTLWSGGAAPDEETGIRDWTMKNAHGIPLALAECFAWHVTKER